MVDEKNKTLTVEEYAVDWEVHTQGQVTTDFVSPKIEQAWMQEAMRRSEAVRSGREPTYPVEDVLQELRRPL